MYARSCNDVAANIKLHYLVIAVWKKENSIAVISICFVICGRLHNICRQFYDFNTNYVTLESLAS